MRSLNAAFQTEPSPTPNPEGTGGRSRAQQRVAAHRWTQRWRQASALVMIGLMVAVIAAYMWAERTGRFSLWTLKAQDGLESRLAQSGLYARNINVSGLGFTSHAAVQEALGAYDRSALSTLSPKEVVTRLEALPWIEQARVQRVWPQTLNIWLKEKQPLAVLHKADGVFVVDHSGEAIVKADRDLINALPNISGEGADAAAPALLAALNQQPDIYGRFVGATYVSDRRWNLFLAPGVEVRLPETNMQAALRTLSDMDRFNQIFDKDLVALDLRGRRPIVLR